MKVLLVHDKDLGPLERADVAGVTAHESGGLAVHLHDVARALVAAGQQVATLDLRPGPDADVRAPGGAGRWRLPGFRFRWNGAVAAALERVLDVERPDVVHVHSLADLNVRLVRRLAERAPLVRSFHDASPVCLEATLLDREHAVCERSVGLACVASGCHRPGSSEGVLRGGLRLATLGSYLRSHRIARRVLTPSTWLAEALLRNGFADERVDVVPLFSRFEGTPDDAPGGSRPGTPHVLFVGRLSRAKGVLDAAEALARLADRPWTATFVGAGARRTELEALVAARGVADRVRFAGELGGADLEREYGAADVLLLPSLAPEAFGLVGVEAMAFGVPVVAYDAGGVREWLTHGDTGLLARHGDVDSLASSLATLLGDAELRRRLGERGRAVRRARFTADRHVAALLAHYESAVREGTA